MLRGEGDKIQRCINFFGGAMQGSKFFTLDIVLLFIDKESSSKIVKIGRVEFIMYKQIFIL